jgi:hypothetical protein
VDSSPGGSISAEADIRRPGGPQNGYDATGWQPPRQGDPITLRLEYDGLAVTEPVVGRASLRLSQPPPKDIEFLVKASGRSCALKGEIRDYLPDKAEHGYLGVAFFRADNAPGFPKAVASSPRMTVVATSGEKIWGTAVFDLSNTHARDGLLASALARIRAPGSSVCSPNYDAVPTDLQYLCREFGAPYCVAPERPGAVLSIMPAR